jgi:hypothetical protein
MSSQIGLGEAMDPVALGAQTQKTRKKNTAIIFLAMKNSSSDPLGPFQTLTHIIHQHIKCPATIPPLFPPDSQ